MMLVTNSVSNTTCTYENTGRLRTRVSRSPDAKEMKYVHPSAASSRSPAGVSSPPCR